VRIRVKICGLTRRDDAVRPPTWGRRLGFNFVDGARAGGAEQAARIVEELPPFVTRAECSPTRRWTNDRIATRRGIQILSCTARDPDVCAPYRCLVQALRVDDSFRPRDGAAVGLAPVLLDGATGARLGGGGRTFDWSRAREVRAAAVIVAGGLDPTTCPSDPAPAFMGLHVAAVVETLQGEDRRRMAHSSGGR